MTQDPRIGDYAVPTPRIRQRPQPISLPQIAVPPAVADALAADNRVIVAADEATDALRAARRNVGEALKDDVLESRPAAPSAGSSTSTPTAARCPTTSRPDASPSPSAASTARAAANTRPAKCSPPSPSSPTSRPRP